jgi:tetrahydromethanopterin S-methyltransferase subunit G
MASFLADWYRQKVLRLIQAKSKLSFGWSHQIQKRGSKVSRKAGIAEQIHFKISREESAFL